MVRKPKINVPKIVTIIFETIEKHVKTYLSDFGQNVWKKE
jgi:hypothetical protein